MKNLDTVAEELFNKIRGRFPSVTIGDSTAAVTNKPSDARFLEFEFSAGKKVSVTLDEDSLTIMYSKSLFNETETSLKSKWYDFLKEIRVFAKKRMLNFDTRDITKSNLDKRDYEYLSREKQMSESKMYGTSRTSYQDIGSARMIVKHANPINQEAPAGRTQQVHSIYIESADGERFKYPYRHLNGARAMSKHVAEGGTPYDTFGKHITGLSEELSKLRKFKTYMNRSNVMAEGLAGYMDIVNERLEAVKKDIFNLQKDSYYKEAVENHTETVLEDVPEDLSNSWIDELTIRQFNEELKGVFPYIYRLVSEANAVEELGPEDLLGEVSSDVEDFFVKVASAGSEGYDMLNDAIMGQYGKEVAKEVQDMYNDVSVDNGLHPDDDQERIYDRMMDDIEADYGGDDYEDDGQPSSYDEYQDLHGGDDWDHGQYDMESAYESHLESIVNNAKHEKGPEMKNQKTFEQYINAMKWAAALGESEFEFNGKTVQVNEKVAQKVTEAGGLGVLGKGLGTVGRGITGMFSKPGVQKGLSDIAGLAKKAPGAVGNAVKGAGQAAMKKAPDIAKGTAQAGGTLAKGVGKSIANNPGKYAIGGAGAYGYSQMPSMDDVNAAIANAGDTIASAPGDIASALGDKLSAMVPNLDQIGAIAAKYALPVGLVIAAIWGGSKLLGSLFGSDERESIQSEDDADTIDLSPKGKGDEMKQKNEIPLDEFIKGYYDYTTNSFPKGETAVLTAVQKQYGDQSVREASSVMQELVSGQDEEMARIQQLAGLR
jgi:hypothetical protein